MPVRSEKRRQQHANQADARPARAILLALRRSGQPNELLRWSTAELEALGREVGIEVVYSLVQTRSGSGVLGSGKLRELAALLDGEGPEQGVTLTPAPDVLLVDAPLTPAQHHALASLLPLRIVDRTELILQLFARRARTRIAKLVVELTRLRHMLPRLREDQSKGGREGGGGRGERGHTQVVLAKQRTRARIATLERELSHARQSAGTQRARRQHLPRVVLVGYTNVGKSSWLSALTGSDTLVANKPFATLDTTVRTMRRKSHGGEPILITDTVGFLRDLPHELVPSFEATLQEAMEADVCLCVADAADGNVGEQLAVTERTLASIGAGEVPRIVLLNKADRLDDDARERLREELPTALLVSSLEPRDVERVRAMIAGHFEAHEQTMGR